MSVVITFRPQGGIKAYRAGVAQLQAQDEKIRIHRSAHYASGTDEDFQVVDVWDSVEDFENFASVLVPILEKTGLDAGVPEIRQLVNTIEPGVAKLDTIGLATWDEHDPNGWVALFADTFTLTDPALPAPLTTRTEAREYIQGWITAFPDLRVRQLDQVCSPRRVAGYVEFTGTHTGPMVTPMGTLEPTGRQVTGTGWYIATSDERGKITSFITQQDVLGLLAQLGVDLTAAS